MSARINISIHSMIAGIAKLEISVDLQYSPLKSTRYSDNFLACVYIRAHELQPKLLGNQDVKLRET